MKYIDRKSIALERFFAKRSDMLTHLDDLTEEGLPEAVTELSLWRRVHLCYIIRDALRYLRDEYSLSSHIPDEVFAVADLSLPNMLQSGGLLLFLQWLRRIHLRNAQLRIPWETSIKSAAARLSSPAASFVRAFFSLSNQRVFITRRGDVLTVTPAEREWGIVTVHFHGTELAEPMAMPLPGFAIAAEVDDTDRSRPVFNLLVDTLFGETKKDFSDRLLSDEGWQTVSFAYNDITVDAVFVDYAARLELRGKAKSDALFELCRILLNKRLIVGVDALTTKERTMMPVVSLLGALGELTSDTPGDFAEWQCEDIILETLSNRSATQGFITSLREYGCDDLAVLMEKAAAESYDDHETEALRCVKLFGLLLDKKLSDGSARLLLHYLYDQFCQMSRQNTGSTSKTIAERRVLLQIDNGVASTMRRLGFSGSFPNFRRTRGDKVEYISFMLDRRSERINHGVMSYGASIAAAQIDSRRLEDYKKRGLDCRDATAFDCLPEALDLSDYGELCNFGDNGPAIFDVDFYAKGEPSVTHAEITKLTGYLDYAEHQFTFGHLPSGYRRRSSARDAIGAFGRSFIRCLPIALCVTVLLLAIYLLVGERLISGALTRPEAACVGLGFCAVFNIIASLCRYALRSRRLWRF